MNIRSEVKAGLGAAAARGSGSAVALNHGSGAAAGEGLIDWIEGASDGPLLLCIGGMHGNEPSGVRALEAIVNSVRARRDALVGDFVAIAGNLRALASGRRFVAYDLNRAWTPDYLGALSAGQGDPGGDETVRSINTRRAGARAPEDLEVLRLLRLLEEVARRRRGPVYALDLHTTSGRGGTFTSTDDRPGHHSFAQAIPLPLVLGLDEHLEGTLLSHLNRLGYTTAVCECGQHLEATAARRAVAAIWLAIRAAGLLGDSDAPEARRAFEMLRDSTSHLPRYLETVYRHPVEEEDGYATRPGWRNFQHVVAGDVVGDDRDGEVVAPFSGMLLMPLYQRLGEDGFFVVRNLGGLEARR